jgi:hypothetical protein
MWYVVNALNIEYFIDFPNRVPTINGASTTISLVNFQMPKKPLSRLLRIPTGKHRAHLMVICEIYLL